MGMFVKDHDDNPQNSGRVLRFPASKGSSLTASAQRVNLNDRNDVDKLRLRGRVAWQSQAWAYYDAIGEISFAFNMKANVVSRARIFPAFVEDPRQPPIDLKDVGKAAKAEADSWEKKAQEQAQTTTPSPGSPDAPVGGTDSTGENELRGRIPTPYENGLPQEFISACESAMGRIMSTKGGMPALLRDIALNFDVAGEALDVNTRVATPTGFVRMGDLQDGDVVLGGDGRPCRVVKAHPIRTDRDCYEVQLGGGISVVADGDHLWSVYQRKDRTWAQQNGHQAQPVVLRTTEMAESVQAYGASNYSIELATIEGDGSDPLPIDPYVLGYWLGDGVATQGAITVHPDDQIHLREQIEAAGYGWSPRPSGRGFQIGITGLQAHLRSADLLGNKHIPNVYLRHSEATRWALLQGLIDSDGHVDKRGNVEFSNTNQELLWNVVELAASLGLRPGQPRRNRVSFRSAGLPVARLPRKAERIDVRKTRDNWHFVRGIDQVKSRPVRCITVDSPDSTFLVTEHMVKTHNCYLVQSPARLGSGNAESWDIKSIDEVVVNRGGTVAVKSRRDTPETEYEKLPANAFVGRMWRSHPRFSGEADSSMRGVLESCADLLLFGRSNRATARSRLNAGALYIPDGLSASAMPDDPGLGEDEELPPEEDHDEFEEELILALTTPIADEESASAVVPLIIRGPADLGEKIKHITFERKFDEILGQRADRALERIMQGIDVPKDLVTGLANVKYSNAVVINLNLYKAHIEPLLLLIADSLTFIWLRPALRAMGQPDELVDKATVWFDPTDIIVQADREAMADAGYDKGLISGEAWRRAHGFSEADKPSNEELAIKKVLTTGQMSPELTEAILGQLAPALFAAMRNVQQETSAAPIPPEVQQALDGAPATPPDATAPAPGGPPQAPAAPAPPAPPATGLQPGVPAAPGMEVPTA